MRIFKMSLFVLSIFKTMLVWAEDIHILEANSIEPYAIQSKDAQIPDSGAELDIFRAVFEGTKYKPQFKFVPLFRVSKDFKSESADGASRMSEPNLKGFYTDPYIRYTGCVITLKERPDIESKTELQKISIVAFQGASTSFGKEFETNVKNNKQYKEMNNQQSQIVLLTLGRVDAIVADLYITRFKQKTIAKVEGIAQKEVKCAYQLHNTPYKAFFKEKLLADLFNVGLRKIISNGTYDKILQKYNMQDELLIKKNSNTNPT